MWAPHNRSQELVPHRNRQMWSLELVMRRSKAGAAAAESITGVGPAWAMAGESDDAYSVRGTGDVLVSAGAGAPFAVTREGAEDDDAYSVSGAGNA